MATWCSCWRSAAERPVAADGETLRRLFERYRRTADRDVRNELIEAHRWVAVHCARRFEYRGEPLDDLLQVAQLGVLKAVERFEPERGRSFAAFAIPTVMGELKRHFRDTTWTMHVPRRLKDMHVLLGPATERLSNRLGRPPTIDELAVDLGQTVDDVLEAIDAGAAYRPGSLVTDAEPSGTEPAILGVEDEDLGQVEDRAAVRRLLARLPARERRIVYLRFFKEMSQSAIAADVGMSQMQVSRLLRASLQALEAQAAGGVEHEPGSGR